MSLFNRAMDYSNDIFRNIRGIKEAQNLFDDLSEDPLDWDAANALDIETHPPLVSSSMIQRAFDYSKNDFLDYPFEHLTASRYSDGSIACWYGSETLETTLYETAHHFIQEILDARSAYRDEDVIRIDRRISLVKCHGLAFDLSHKTKAFPWLVDPVDYTKCQEIGKRVAHEGHPLLRVASARQVGGINLVVFNRNVLSNPREYCYLQYILNLKTAQMNVYRGADELKIELPSEQVHRLLKIRTNDPGYRCACSGCLQGTSSLLLRPATCSRAP